MSFKIMDEVERPVRLSKEPTVTVTETETFADTAEAIVGELEGGKPSPAVRAALAQTYATLALVEATRDVTTALGELEGRVARLGDELDRSIRRAVR